MVSFTFSGCPVSGEDAFGHNPLIRISVALAGGILLGLGARRAGGCTSGHGISGSIQLSPASIITACCFFIGDCNRHSGFPNLRVLKERRKMLEALHKNKNAQVVLGLLFGLHLVFSSRKGMLPITT